MKIKVYKNASESGGNYAYTLPDGYTNNISINSAYADWISTVSVTGGIIIYGVDANTTNKTRVGYYIIKASNEDGTDSIEITIEVRQYTAYIPVCSDTFYNTDSNTFNYTISTDEDGVIYTGKATALPTGSGVEININKICYPYLSTQFPLEVFTTDSNNLFDMDTAIKKFYLTNLSYGSVIGDYIFYNAWEKNVVGDSYGNILLSAPIKNTIDTRQYFLTSVFKKANNTFNISYVENGVTNTIISKTNETDNIYLYTGRNYLFDGRQLKVDNTLVYEVKETCHKWCIYYKNLFGGYDSLLVDGNVVESTEYSPEMYTTNFNNLLPDAEHHKYINVGTNKYKMYVSANDDESSRMKHLFGSCELYLHNLESGDIVPVIIEGTFSKKTYKNQGNHKYTYEINLTEARDNVIR